jgi:hypothetical protein
VGTTSAATTVVASGPNSSTVTKVDMGGLNPPPLPVLGAIVRLPSPPCDHAARPPVPQRRWAARLASPRLATFFSLFGPVRVPLSPEPGGGSWGSPGANRGGGASCGGPRFPSKSHRPGAASAPPSLTAHK